MRFMLIMGGANANRAKAYYEISMTLHGGTVGIIGSQAFPPCFRPEANMIVTSNGTLLLTTGLGPMLRMRQNEKVLTTAGVPAPRQPIIIATGVDLGSQPAQTTIYFDYTRFGNLRGTFNPLQGRAIQETPEGIASREQRMVDMQRILSLVVPTNNADFLITVTGTNQLVTGSNGAITPYGQPIYINTNQLSQYGASTDASRNYGNTYTRTVLTSIFFGTQRQEVGSLRHVQRGVAQYLLHLADHESGSRTQRQQLFRALSSLHALCR